MRKSALLTPEQMEALTTKRLLAYKNRLYKVPETETTDRYGYKTVNSFLYVTKESPEWKATVVTAKKILSAREHVAKN